MIGDRSNAVLAVFVSNFARAIIPNRRNQITVVAFNAKGTCFVSGSEDRTVKIWTVVEEPPSSHPKKPRILRGHRELRFIQSPSVPTVGCWRRQAQKIALMALGAEG